MVEAEDYRRLVADYQAMRELVLRLAARSRATAAGKKDTGRSRLGPTNSSKRWSDGRSTSDLDEPGARITAVGSNPSRS
jgi:hypothetical protein